MVSNDKPGDGRTPEGLGTVTPPGKRYSGGSSYPGSGGSVDKNLPKSEPLPDGTELLQYRILSCLGHGGMGTVYLAEDTRLGRTIALKVFPKELSAKQEWVYRFEREARLASSLSHPGVATLYDFHRDGELAFFTMEYVEGRSLRQLLEGGPVPPDQLLECAIQTAQALSSAHQKGVIHRDLKPENVMLSDSGFYKILDFGLARMEPSAQKDGSSGPDSVTMTRELTQRGVILGTVTYMSPEQAQGQPADARSDIFTLGGVLYELAAGEPPFRRNNEISTFHAIVHEDPAPLRTIKPEVPEGLDQIIAKCLQKEPGERYQNVNELLSDLSALRDGRAPLMASAMEKQASQVAMPSRTGRKVLMGLGIVALLVVLAFAAKFLTEPSRQRAGRLMIPPETVRVAAPADRSRIAVASFNNRTGDSKVDWLTSGLPEMLTTDLAQSGNLQVISTEKMSDLLKTTGDSNLAELDQGTAVQLARYAGAGVLISGSIFKNEDAYRIDARASDTQSGEVITAAKVEGENIFEMVADLTAQLRGGLQMAAKGPRPLYAVATNSEEAFRHYTTGMDHYKNLRFADGAREFEESLAADGDFALARLRLGMSLYLSGNREKGLPYIFKASEQADRLPERERLLSEGIQVCFHTDEADIEHECVANFAAQFPEDQEGYFWRARTLADAHGENFEAIKVLRKVVTDNPDNLPATATLSIELEKLGESESAQQVILGLADEHPQIYELLNEMVEVAVTMDETEVQPLVIKEGPDE